MISASLPDQQKLFGLFELDSLGTILYSRVEPDEDHRAVAPNVDGHDFFNDIALFENAEELRLRIRDFSNSGGHAANFHFTCLCDTGPLVVKVLLARVRERSDGKGTKSILMHIRKVQPDAD
jgi:hypothetical protein